MLIRHMKSMANLLLLVLFSSSLSCVQTPVKRYYTLVNRSPKMNITAQVCSKTVVLASLESSAPYDDDKIVFRTDAYEIKHFNYRLWVGPPRDMLEGLLINKLEKAKIFKAVESFSHSDADHLTLYGRLNIIEEHETKDKWNARLAMTFRLKTERDENIIWKYAFDQTEEVEEENIESFLETMNRIYNKEIDRMLAALASFLPSYESCAFK